MSDIFSPNTSEELLNHRYQIQKELGRNTGRSTFLAKDLQNQQLVVIKFLTFNHDFRWEDLKLFEREVQIIQSLSHPAIPQYIEYFEVDTPKWRGFALVQTYIEAQSLQKHLSNGRTFSEAEVKQLAKALLSILDYLHTHEPPAIHRDIKPSNILLANRSAHSIGDIYLVDFGSVQTANCQDGTITIVGTYGYMPPEQFGGKVFPASDLYSLGATLIYLITGVEPADLPQEDLQIQFEKFANISSNFREWLNLMTHPSLKKRFSSAQEALEALESRKITLQNPPLSKIILTKTADSINITIPYKQNKAAVQSNSQAVNKIKQDYQKSWLNKILAILTLRHFWYWAYVLLLMVLCLVILGVVVFMPGIFLWGIFQIFPVYIRGLLILSIGVAIVNYLIKLSFSEYKRTFFKVLTPDDHIRLDILKNIKSINLLIFTINQHEIALDFNYTSQLKQEEIYTVFRQSRQDISGILLEKKSYKLIETQNEGGKEVTESEVAPSLYITMGNRRYGLHYQLTPPELYWLAEVISDFLDIPITKS
ncbi:serine/threonine protein kinase [Nostoc sp. NIES-4103]|nr:serine/threonine protein kinase [Nostoc sp. NIES-4103]